MQTSVIYARVSSAVTENRQNTERQVIDLREYANYAKLPTMFAPIMIATLSTCAQLERENIKFRLSSGLKAYVAKGGKVGRKKGSVKTMEQRANEYKDIICYLKKGYSIRVTAKLTDKSISTVQRVKKDFQL